jgi:hypothetical protein
MDMCKRSKWNFFVELVTVVVGLGGLGIWGVGMCKAGRKFMRDG